MVTMHKNALVIYIIFLSIRPAIGQSGDLQVSRVITKEEDGHRVEITISTQAYLGMAKVTELIPQNYAVQKEKIGGANFSFADNKVQYVWMSFPFDETVKISYFLKWIGKTDTDHSEIKNITGELYYIAENRKRKVPIITIHEEILPEKKGIKLVPANDSQDE